jgi:transposase
MGRRRALEELERWVQWARRSRLKPFVKLARTITAYRPSIEFALRSRVTNARAEFGESDHPVRLKATSRFG